ncbi:polyprenyl synthetase family protein [Wenzhouxiangella sp. XN79A]|uniref:polyprenyl synthetase family protein n=1 Tax=Wenzhouxiangella sp. XN79A TaxID=2724193 RepID=UPI00144AD500|nr:polyprenyl synthetase family protein [Wenzhouxiangella sp. XN79A]NKI34001.1 polyprenyl synthetase family protein [Wenzhouxiangella sp. XN79A]
MAATTEDAMARGEGAESIDASWRQAIDERLQALMPVQALDGNPTCRELAEAMRYSLLAPGKRVRPLLAIRTALHFGADPNRMLDFGCALEMVHCASLMLDDLPCMDDASTRRGQPACHRKFGDATTTLAAIALLNQAFGVIARDSALDPSQRCWLVDRLSVAVGTAGLVSGQCRDLIERAGALDGSAIAEINHQKTGVLFELATAGAGGILGLADDELDALQRYAGHLGQAFQAADDLLDVRRHAEGSGKDIGLDRDKAGSVHRVGEQALRRLVEAELAAGDRVLPAARGEHALDGYVRALFARFV